MGKKTKSCCLTDLSPFFKALGDGNRLSILNHLCGCSRANVGELGSCCDVDISVVSRHLGTLKKAKLLRAEKKGKEVYYSINSQELVKTLRSIADFVESCNCKKE